LRPTRRKAAAEELEARNDAASAEMDKDCLSDKLVDHEVFIGGAVAEHCKQMRELSGGAAGV